MSWRAVRLCLPGWQPRAADESGDHGRELEVHVSRIARLAGWKLVVYVHGARAGTMTV